MAWYESPSTFFIFGIAASITACSWVHYLVELISELSSSALLIQERRRETLTGNVETGYPPETSFAYLHVQEAEEQPFIRLQDEFVVTTKKLREVVLAMMREMKKGLLENAKGKLPIKMLPSFFTQRPAGDEVGTYYSIDLGGTNFRVCEVFLEAVGRVRMRQTKHVITNEMKALPAVVLFDRFAHTIREFLEGNKLDPAQHRSLGMTFSFPVQQTTVNRGTMIQWNKGFTCSGIIGEDVVEMMTHSLERVGVNMEIVALVNDTVGTLISHAYSDPQAHISVVLGTGTNAAYYEEVKNIKKNGIYGQYKGYKEMIINTEWGGYDDTSVLPVTKYDKMLDEGSVNPGLQIFEKLISGMYLGEIVRYAIVNLHESGDLFKVGLSDELKIPYAFGTVYMSRVERDHSSELLDTRTVLESVFNQPNTTLRDRSIVKHVCQLVGIRAARLASAGIAAIATRINRLHDCTVAVDGSLFESYPHYANRIRDSLYDILGAASENIILDQAKDGSGRGAAIASALSAEK